MSSMDGSIYLKLDFGAEAQTGWHVVELAIYVYILNIVLVNGQYSL